jgi:cytochrome c oxidase subunit II
VTALRNGTALAVLISLSGCRGDQSSLDPAGHQAQAIADHWWFFLIVCTVVYVLVLAATGWAMFRRNRAPADEEQSERRITRVVAASVGATVIIVFVFLVHAVWTGRTLGSLPRRDMITIEVVAHQWWWDISYKQKEAPYLRTANEIHIPVGEPVQINVISRDVIHSFWVPNLHGKIDAVPGRLNNIVLQADRPGVFRGQCAEFCGLQHAHMAFLVIAQPRAEYDHWIAAQRQPSRPPATAEEQRGHDLFVSSQCAVCHMIRGTTAFGRTGPDLTHLASRRTLAAATLPFSRGHLGGWVADPQGVKPGNRMPRSDFESQDFNALLAYLESLK